MAWIYANLIDTSRSNNTFLFRTGDFIEFRGRYIGRLDHIILHDYNNKRRIFCIISRYRQRASKDKYLDQPFVIDLKIPMIIGVTAIDHARPYVINADRPASSPGFIRITWDLMFL